MGLKLFSEETHLARDDVGADAGRPVGHADQLTIADTAAIATRPKLFHRHQVKRLPVPRDGRLAGIVARAVTS